MNLHTYMIMKLKEKTDVKKHHANILRKVDTVLKHIDDLREDPLFIEKIHGEQELSLDQTIELQLVSELISLQIKKKLSYL